MRKNSRLFTFAAWALVAVAGLVNPEVNAQEDRFSELYKRLQHPAILKYENQLITSQGEKYATLRSLPVPNNSINPFVLHKLNENEIENIPMFTLSGFRDIYQASAKIKIPSGTHSLTIRGGGWRSVIRTALPQISFEANNDYLIVHEPAGRSATLRLFTYTTDSRFSPLEKDHYILVNSISEPVLLGETQK